MRLRRVRSDPAPVVVALNYHRVGPIDRDNPFHTLHTVSEDTFVAQLDLIERSGRCVSLGDVVRTRDLGLLNFLITFDDVSIDAQNGIRHLRERQLPYALSVCTALADDGYGTRDKVYAIQQCLTDGELRIRVASRLGSEFVGDGFSFYRFTKSDVLDATVMAERLIDPLFEEIRPRVARWFEDRQYLSWEELGEMNASDPLLTLVNHGQSHHNMTTLSTDARSRDVLASHRRFEEELGMRPEYFAVPFGKRTPGLVEDLTASAVDAGYGAVLWVGTGANRIEHAPHDRPAHLVRLHTARSVKGFRAALRAAVKHAVRCEVPSVLATPRSGA